MLLKIFKNRTVSSSGTWGTKNENNYEILDFEFPEELEEYNKRIVYYLGNQKVWDVIIDNKAILTNAITTKGSVKAYIWCTKSDEAFETDVDFRTQIFVMNFFENENADGIVPTPEQIDGFNTMLTAMNEKIEEINELETTIENAETQRQENEETRQQNESTRQDNEQTRQEQEAERERRTDEAIGEIEDLTEAYNQNAQQKTEAFNNNATQKTDAFNQNAESKTNTFNTNATNKTNDFNSNASSKTNTFNENATSKTNTFNSNANDKTSAFNDNATQKTTNFDNNASSKTTTFNENATSKTNDFNDNATAKTTAFNENALAKTEAFDEHTAEITADIEDLQQEVEELSENMPWSETEQATEIDITDAAKYSKNKMKVFGNTEQTQYRGVQLFDKANANILDNTYIGSSTLGISSGAKTLYISCQPNTTYTISRIAGQRFIVGDTNVTPANQVSVRNRTADNTGTSITITTSADASYLVVFYYLSSADTLTPEAIINSLQIEQGSTATNYEPYTGGVPSPNPDYPQPIHVVTGENIISVGSTNYPINLGNIELCKIGNYQDYLYKENGNWYEYGAISHNVATGASTEQWTWSLRNENKAMAQSTHIGNCIDARNFIAVYSNYFKGSNGNDVFNSSKNNINIIGCAEQNKIRIAVSPNDFANIDDFKNFLQENNLDFYFVLATSTTTQITDETLIAQLDAIYEHLQLVKGTNHITITPSDLEPYVTLNYMQDLPSKLDNLDSRLSLLE